MDKLRSDGILNDILQTIPVQTKRPLTGVGNGTPLEQQSVKSHLNESKRLEAKSATSLAAKLAGRAQPAYHIEPNRRYLSIRLVSVRAMVDFINPKEDEFIYCSISFLKQRFQTQAVAAAAELIFNDDEGSFLFDIDDVTSRSAMIDPAMLLKLNQSIHVSIIK